MKKYYACPMVEVKAFDVEDVVMVSGINMSQESQVTHGDKLNDVKSTFKSNVKATTPQGIVVEW